MPRENEVKDEEGKFKWECARREIGMLNGQFISGKISVGNDWG